MKEESHILVRLFPYVYMDKLGGTTILYDTISKKLAKLNFDEKCSYITKTAFSIKETPLNKIQVKIIEANKLGRLDYVRKSADVLSDFSTMLYTRCMEALSNRYYKYTFSLSMVKKLFVNLSSSTNVFSGNKIYRGVQAKPYAVLPLLENHISNLNKLSVIHIYATKELLTNFKNNILQLTKGYKIFIEIPWESYTNRISTLFKNATVILSINKLDANVLTITREICSKKKNVNAAVYIHSANEYKIYSEFVIKYNTRFILKICPEANIHEFMNLLCYSEEDILSTSVNVADCVRNEWINALYFGNVYIDYNGKVMLNAEHNIGNIKNWRDIKFEKLLSKSSLWRCTRMGSKMKCNKCSFRNLCPPLSLCEISNKTLFCKIK